MQLKDLKSRAKLTPQLEEAGEKRKNNCKRCNGTGMITTWYDCSETHKITSDCPVCPPLFELQSLREFGL